MIKMQVATKPCMQPIRTKMAKRKLRSESWFNIPDNPGMTAIYVERFVNYGMTRKELMSGKPIIGITQIGSDITPCNRIHLQTVERARDGVRDAGGIPFVFPVHPIQESVRRPTAAIDRNLSYLALVEILHGYPFDAVILTAGCDKTTPAALMAVATANLPAIVLSGGPMLDSYYNGELAGSGVCVWEGRKMVAAGEIDMDEFMEMVEGTSLSAGHCNTMGTALTMNCIAEALGMSLTGCAAIPAAYRERLQISYETGQRAVEIVHEDLTPQKVMTKKAFENAIVTNTAIGGSTNAPPHLTAIARHMDVDIGTEDWQRVGFDVPLLVNCQPAGKYLGETFHRGGGLPSVMHELSKANLIHKDALTITGKTMGENVAKSEVKIRDIIRSVDEPLIQQAGLRVLSGNLFDSGLIKTCVISEEFRTRYLSEPGKENYFEARAIVFEGPEDYHARINDSDLKIDDRCILVVRGCGPVGFPGSAEVVNMQPPDALLAAGTRELPTLGDGRQSGTCASPSILNVSPESAVGGTMALIQTDDRIAIDLNEGRVDLLVSAEELSQRRENYTPPEIKHHTPWEELYREKVDQLCDGGCLSFATKYHNTSSIIPRHNH